MRPAFQRAIIALLLLLAAANGRLFAQTEADGQSAAAYLNEPRVALVIGNGSYSGAPLRNPANDAADMAQVLRQLGFKVTLRVDANQRQMRQALREFGAELKRGGVGLFYFAGHGIQSRGRNYLIPIGASIESEAELEDESVDANRLLSLMDEARNRVNIVILDACRNNPFARFFRSTSGGLAQMEPAKGTFVAFATAPGSVAADGTGRNGVYTERLLTSLKHPDGDIDKVFRRVASEVSTVTNGRQVPWVSSSLTGDFYFRMPVAKPVDDTRLRQAEAERATLTKALDEERRKRETDAEALKREMEKLRAELQQIRAASTREEPRPAITIASAPPEAVSKPLPIEPPREPVSVLALAPSEPRSKPVPAAQDSVKEVKPPPQDSTGAPESMPSVIVVPAVPATPVAQPEKPPPVIVPAPLSPADKPSSVVASAPVAPVPPASVVSAPQKRVADPPAPTSQVALLSPAPGVSGRSDFGSRLALLEKFEGPMTFPKAVALLLDIDREQDLTQVLQWEAHKRRLVHHSAFAIGVSSAGWLSWGWTSHWRSAEEAGAEAFKRCARQPQWFCRTVMINGIFRPKEFLEVARQLGKRDVGAVRQEFLIWMMKNVSQQ